MICLAEKKDALDMAKIHKQEIKKGFLSSLPLRFLEKIYSAVIENDFCVTDKEGGKIIGFIAGTADIKKLYSEFAKRYFFYSIFIFLPKILNVKKIFEDIFYINKKDVLRSELLTIAVRKNFRGQGVAKEMLEVFILEMKKRGVKSFKVVVGEELKPAINFYEKSGFKLLGEAEVHRGEKSRIYIYEF